jgi:HTH-like domain
MFVGCVRLGFDIEIVRAEIFGAVPVFACLRWPPILIVAVRRKVVDGLGHSCRLPPAIAFWRLLISRTPSAQHKTVCLQRQASTAGGPEMDLPKPWWQPRAEGELADLIARLAVENPAWGYVRIQDELRKVGHRVSRATIARLLRIRRIPPAPQRSNTTWRQFLRTQATRCWAHDFLYAECARSPSGGCTSCS